MKIRYHNAVLRHNTGLHPESASRIEAFGPLAADPADWEAEAWLPLAHDTAYIERVRAHSASGLPFDADTIVSRGSFDAACAAVELTIRAMETGDFALVRPPGHHAYRNEARGFCLFNNIAIAAAKAVAAGKRVLILDFDGHLGDGTMSIFYESDQVFYWSLHQYPAYPGHGAANETGVGAGKGYTLNVPLPPGAADDIMLHAIDYLWGIAEQFKPDVVAVSAGFDAHYADPLLQLNASDTFYYKTALRLRESFGGKIFAALEGGYNTKQLPRSVRNFIAGVNGEKMAFPETGMSSGLRAWETYEMNLHYAASLMAAHWKFGA